jgi:hypothetical protein
MRLRFVTGRTDGLLVGFVLRAAFRERDAMVADGRQRETSGRLTGFAQRVPLKEPLAHLLKLGASDADNLWPSLIPLVLCAVSRAVTLGHEGAAPFR